MGITNINPLLQKHAPNAFFSTALSHFSGKRIAIDASNYIYKPISNARKEYITKMADPLEPINASAVRDLAMSTVSYILTQLATYKITPVFVWDGKSSYAKDKCKAERVAAKDKIKNDIETLKAQLLASHALFRDARLIKEYKQKLCQLNTVSREDLTFFKSIIKNLGFPSIEAPSEAEKACAELTMRGICVAVWSTDTDNYALGTPIMITGFGGVNEVGIPLVNVVDVRVIMKSISCSFAWLQDLCIMAGCDFNDNMKGVGPVTAFKLMKKYGSIEELQRNEPHHPFEILNHIQCRELFSREELPELGELNFCIDAYSSNFTSLMDEYPILITYYSQFSFIASSLMYIVPKNHSIELPINIQEQVPEIKTPKRPIVIEE